MKTVSCPGIAGAMAILGAGAAFAAAESDPPEQARIAFADMGGIRDWRAEGRDTLYVQGRGGQWYRAAVYNCAGLPSAQAVGFVFEPSGSFDRFSSIVVDGQVCPIKSVVKSEAPSATAESNRMRADASGESGAREQTDSADSGAGGSEPTGESARIPFANLGGIRSWRAVDEDTLYIEGRSSEWFRAELFGFCPGLQFEHRIGFVAEPTGGFDRFSSIIVDGRECRLKSLTKSAPPQKADK